MQPAAPVRPRRPERDARLLQRRRPLPRPGSGDRARRSPWRSRGRTSSTSAGSRPGPAPCPSPPEEEARRVLPVIERLVAAGVRVSVDTRRAARRRRRGRRRGLDRERRRRRRATPRCSPWPPPRASTWSSCTPAAPPRRDGGYGDVVEDVARRPPRPRARRARRRGAGERIVLDPGIGFSKYAGRELAPARLPRAPADRRPAHARRRLPEAVPGRARRPGSPRSGTA